jgi:hypothetical protein
MLGKSWRRRIVLCLLAIAAPGLVDVRAAPVDEKQVEAHLQAFYEAALWNDGRWPVWIQRWNQPIKVRMIGPMSTSYTDMVMDRLTRMATLAGLTVTALSPDAKDENLLVEFVDTAQLYAAGRSAGCVANYTSGSGSTIARARLVINLRQGFGLRRCISHELMHGLGYNREDLTQIDEMLLRVLYDPRMKPGSFQLPAMALARDIIVDKLGGGESADTTRRLGETYLKRLVPTMVDLAEKGNVGLQYQIGVAYTFGQTLEKDEASGFLWLKRAAATTLTPEWSYWINQGRFMVGYGLQNGRGTQADPADGARWYRLAADAGHLIAQNNLGVAYRDGKGVERDKIEAYRWFSVAAEKKYQLSETNLRRLEPTLTPEEIVEAKKRIVAGAAAKSPQ